MYMYMYMCTCRPSHNHKVNMSNRSMSNSITQFRQTVLQNIFSKAIPSEQLFPPQTFRISIQSFDINIQ